MVLLCNYLYLQILFPMLSSVRTQFRRAARMERSDSAPGAHLSPLPNGVSVEDPFAAGAGSGGKLLVHHSRDSPEKQWAETLSLSLLVFARVLAHNLESLMLILGKCAPLLCYVFFIVFYSRLSLIECSIITKCLRN